MKTKKPTILIILDGFGYSSETLYNAIAHAHKPTIDYFLKMYPHTTLLASGIHVGLIDGFIGNSEVGHMTIGAGRIIQQPASFIQESIDNKSFFSHPILLQCLQNSKEGSERLHIMGLVSDAGVHSHINHLYAFLRAAKQQGINNIYVHAFLDGRDVGPKSAETYLNDLIHFMAKENIGILGSIQGRFYAMDRDKNWDRTKKSYEVLTGKIKNVCKRNNWKELLETYYKKGITDEFIPPILLHEDAVIKKGDGVIFFNFRPDRARQIITSLLTDDLPLACFMTLVDFGLPVPTDYMFEKDVIENTLIDVLNENKKTIFVIAETEKYAHVTYFFKGGKEKALEYETDILIPSLKLKNYAKNPKMSAEPITSAVITSLQNDPKDFYLVNYANADMVGHSGDFDATIKAIECLDAELKKLYIQVIKKMDGTMYITADHGNAECMFDVQTGQPHTAHTTNSVPFIMIQKGLEQSKLKLPLKQLADIAPFILKNMGLVLPDQMKWIF